MPILKRNGKTFSGTPTKVDTAKSYTTFDSADDKNPTTWSDVELLTSKEEQRSLFSKISTMFKNIRYLYKILGTTDISAIGDGTVTGGIDAIGNKLGNTDISGIGDGTVTGGLSVLNSNLVQINYQGAGSHNAIYRGKNLGTSVTEAQYAAISAGTFDDLYIGDYWVINGVTWRIADFDYYLHCGNRNLTTHHAVIVPDTCLYYHVMNDSNVTTGGYVGSKMYTEGLEQAKTTIKAAFSGHVLKHREFLVNATVDGKPSGWAWFDSEVELMNEVMVYGSVAWGAHDGNGYNVASGNGQFHLFSHDHSRAHNRDTWWLRDVVSATHFALVGGGGYAHYTDASKSNGVRPAFCIKG